MPSISTVLFSLIAALGFAGAALDLAMPRRQAVRVPVLAELFTSEGCSSCPPADDLLRRLIDEQPVDGVEVIGISEHVDYWNRLGWADPYSAPAFSRRQEAYGRVLPGNSVYTPQLVADGRLEVVGSDWNAVRGALVEAAKAPRAALDVQAVGVGDSKLEVRVAVRDVPSVAARHPMQVILAVVEDGLTSDVQRGENARRRLRHSAVARSLAIIGTLKPRVTSGEFTSPVTLERAWARDRLRLVAFVQDEKTLSIVGSGFSPARF